MTTARTLVKAILRKISVLGSGSVLSAEDAQDCMAAINAMIASWSAEGDMVYVETKETLPLVVGKATYSIGPGADFDTVRPNQVIAAYITESSYDYPLNLRGVQDWTITRDKTQTGTPSDLYYNTDFPSAALHIWPAPSQASTITLITQKPLKKFATLDTVYELPEEYERAIIFNGAVEVGPEYEREPSPTVRRIAMESKAIIESQNGSNNPSLLRVDDALVSGGVFNIMTGRNN